MTDFLFYFSFTQCSDLTLAKDFAIPSNIACTNFSSHSDSASGITIGYTGALGFVMALFMV
jgi:hypothetical protein